MYYDFVRPDDGVADFRIEFSGKAKLLTVLLKNHKVFEERIHVLVTAPAQVRIGENGIDPGLTKQGFTGRIEVMERVVRQDLVTPIH